MPFGSIACYAWWLVAGALAGWLLYWLIDRLFLRNGETAARLAAAEEAVTVARNEATTASRQITDLNHRIEQSTQLSNGNAAKLAAAISERDALHQKLADTSQQLTSTTGRLNSLTLSDNELHQEIERLHGELNEAQIVAAKSAEESRSLQARIADLTTTSRGADEQVASLREQLKAATDAAAKGSATLSGELNSARQSTAAMQTELSSYSAEIAQLKDQLRSRTQRAEGLDKEIERLKAELSGMSTLQSQIAALQANVTAKERAAGDAQAQVAELKGLLEQQKRTAGDASRYAQELTASRAEVERINKELHVAQEWLTRLGTDLENERAAQQGHVADNSRLKAEIAKLTAQIANYDRLRKALEAAREAADLGLDLHKQS